MTYQYETDGAAIYKQSFATIRAEADLARFAAEEEGIVVRMIHAAGMVGLEKFVKFSPDFAVVARQRVIRSSTRKRTPPMVISRPTHSNSSQGARPSTQKLIRKRRGSNARPNLPDTARTLANPPSEIEG